MTAWADSHKIGYISLQEYEERTLALENTSIRKGLLSNNHTHSVFQNTNWTP